MPKPCGHTDVREFEDLRSCLECGDTWFGDEDVQSKASSLDRSYVYADLGSLEREQVIRLVLLEPGDDSDPIRCNLIISQLRHYSEYDAVSYTWAAETGDDERTQQIFIDDSVLCVTKNCEAALRRLRHNHRYRRIWIDAICINQSNSRERNHQVGIMDSIYREATQVHVCIELPDGSVEDFMRWLTTNEARDFPSRLAIEQMRTLLQCRYFARTWVIQEMALAKAVILHVNNQQAVLTHDTITNLREMSEYSKLVFPGPLQMRLVRNQKWSLTEALKASLSSSCSDARDKVYGILSLLESDIRALITVDYKRTVVEVFAEVILACLKSEESLSILAYVALPSSYENLACACSFGLEDLSRYLETTKSSNEFEINHPKSWTSSPSLLTSSQQDSISLSLTPGGRSFSMPVQKFDTNIPKSLLFPCFEVVAHQIDFCVVPDEDGFEIFGKCLKWQNFQTAAHHHLGYPDYAHGLDVMKHWLLDYCQTGYITDEDTNIKEKLQLEAATAIGVTRHGLVLCSSPVVSQPGDQVFLLDTLRSPVLLRHLTASRYRMVGVCRWVDTRGALCWDRLLATHIHDNMSSSDRDFVLHEEPGFSAGESNPLYPGFVDQRVIEIY